jgi:LysM repeat protein
MIDPCENSVHLKEILQLWHNSIMHLFMKAVVLMFLAALFLAPSIPARAQSFGAGDVLAAVNALRKASGLTPYQPDSGLMSYAQEHSEYQARTGQSTHTHSDGLRPSAYGITENIAAGSVQSLTTDYIVYQIWADALHMNTMIGYDSGFAGVGVAVNGGTVYVTLDVRPGQSASTLAPSGSGQPGSTNAPAGTQIALVPLITATPSANGSIVHEVGYGQSLWSIAIAYGVRINEIRSLNGLAPDSTDIYSGQKLVIRQAGLVTPAAQETQVPIGTTAANPTNPPPLLTVTPIATASLIPSPTATIEPRFEMPELTSTRIIAIGLIVVGLVGVVGVLFSGLRRADE